MERVYAQCCHILYIVFEIFDVQFQWPWTRTVQGHPGSKVIVLIESPVVVSYLTSFESNIVSLTVFENWDYRYFSIGVVMRINSTSGLADRTISYFHQKHQITTSPGTPQSRPWNPLFPKFCISSWAISAVWDTIVYNRSRWHVAVAIVDLPAVVIVIYTYCVVGCRRQWHHRQVSVVI